MSPERRRNGAVGGMYSPTNMSANGLRWFLIDGIVGARRSDVAAVTVAILSGVAGPSQKPGPSRIRDGLDWSAPVNPPCTATGCLL